MQTVPCNDWVAHEHYLGAKIYAVDENDEIIKKSLTNREDLHPGKKFGLQPQ